MTIILDCNVDDDNDDDDNVDGSFENIGVACTPPNIDADDANDNDDDDVVDDNDEMKYKSYIMVIIMAIRILDNFFDDDELWQ